MESRATRTHRSLRSALLLAVAASASGCLEPDQFLPAGQAGGPVGVLDGTVTYVGPLPCTENKHIVGAAVMLIFNTELLPPPEGLGTTAQSIAVVAGEELFAGVRSRLTFNDDGSRWCPKAGTQTTVSSSWAASPLEGGTYQVRAFYDLDGNFNPVFSIYKLPTKGDIGGGAVDNATDVLMGAAPIYREISLGDPQDGGTRKIPDTGSRVGGISVTLGLPLPLDLPTFYPKRVLYSETTCKNGTVVPAAAKTADPRSVTMPSDYTLPVFTAANPGETEASITRIGLQAGLPADEKAIGAKAPFNFPVNGKVAPTFHFSWQDANLDGKLDLDHDHTPDSPLVPSLFPLAIFSKLALGADGKNQDLIPQSEPVVIIQGLTIYKDLVSTVQTTADLQATAAEVIVGVRPAVLCIDPEDPAKHAKLLVTHPKDCGGHTILTNPASTAAALGKQFNRTVDVVFGCLPQGRYAMNLVYPTGQAWSVPNEMGVCSPLEPQSKDGKECVAGTDAKSPRRARLASQDVVLTIGPPDDPAYCAANKTPPECLPPTKK